MSVTEHLEALKEKAGDFASASVWEDLHEAALMLDQQRLLFSLLGERTVLVEKADERTAEDSARLAELDQHLDALDFSHPYRTPDDREAMDFIRNSAHWLRSLP